MDKCATSTRQRLKNMLSEAISGFCRNMVEHSMHLSVEGLVGITVDGSDVLLVSIKEQFDKLSGVDRHATHSSDKTYETHCDESYSHEWALDDDSDVKVNTNCPDDATESYFADDIDDGATVEYNNVEHNQDFKYGSHVKVEPDITDGSQYALVPRSNRVIGVHEQYRTSHNGSQPGLINNTGAIRNIPITNNNYAMNNNASNIEAQNRHSTNSRHSNFENTEDCNYLFDESGMTYSNEGDAINKNRRMSQGRAVGHQSRGRPSKQGTQKRSAATKTSLVRKAPRQNVISSRISKSVEADTFEEGNEEWPVDPEYCPEPEVKVTKVYTCKLCNQQLSHYTSYKRHMQTHQGVAYKCNGCGKYLARADSLKLHKRKCPSAFEIDDDTFNT